MGHRAAFFARARPPSHYPVTLSQGAGSSSSSSSAGGTRLPLITTLLPDGGESDLCSTRDVYYACRCQTGTYSLPCNPRLRVWTVNWTLEHIPLEKQWVIPGHSAARMRELLDESTASITTTVTLDGKGSWFRYHSHSDSGCRPIQEYDNLIDWWNPPVNVVRGGNCPPSALVFSHLEVSEAIQFPDDMTCCGEACTLLYSTVLER